jgi:hypothetical protein
MESNQDDRLPLIADLDYRVARVLRAILVFALCYLAAKLGGTLIINVPQTLWPL